MDDESSSSTPLYMKMLLASLVYVVSLRLEEGWGVWRMCVRRPVERGAIPTWSRRTARRPNISMISCLSLPSATISSVPAFDFTIANEEVAN